MFFLPPIPRYEDAVLVLELLGWAGPARGPEAASQRSYSISSAPGGMSSFERYTFTTVGGENFDCLAARITVNKTSQLKGSNQKIILR